jgi:hypothetical protein
MPPVKAPQVKKPKSLKRLPGLGKPIKEEPLPSLDTAPQRIASVVDDELEALTRTLDDRQLAKRVLKLKQKFPTGTFPELVVYDWLERHNARFEYQFAVLGGRAIKGGQVLDFVVDRGIDVLVWEIQGLYWHTRPGKIRADEAERLALLGIEILRKKVGGVVEIWDTRIMDKHKRSSALNAAMNGLEMGI